MNNRQRISMIEDNIYKSYIRYDNLKITYEEYERLRLDGNNRIKELRKEK